MVDDDSTAKTGFDALTRRIITLATGFDIDQSVLEAQGPFVEGGGLVTRSESRGPQQTAFLISRSISLRSLYLGNQGGIVSLGPSLNIGVSTGVPGTVVYEELIRSFDPEGALLPIRPHVYVEESPLRELARLVGGKGSRVGSIFDHSVTTMLRFYADQR